MLEELKREIRARAEDRGVGVVEFALVAPIFLLLVLGLMDMGRATMLYNSVATAAQEGARFGMVLRDASWSTNFTADGNDNVTYGPGIAAYVGDAYANTIVGQVARKSGALDLNLTTVVIAFNGNAPGRGSDLTVTVSHSFAPVAGSLLHISSFTVSAPCTVRLE